MQGCQPLVSVVVPTLNAGRRFAKLMETLRAQRVPGTVEIVAVDTQSRDGTAELARKFGARVLFTSRSRFSHGGTRNQAIQAATGEYVALTVQDALPTDDHWLIRLLTPLLTQPEVAGSYGLQVAPASAGLLARARSGLWCRSNREPKTQALEHGKGFQAMTPEDRLALIRFDNVTSCIRRSTWEEIPFPERPYAEDLAWAKEVLLRGKRIAYVPTAQVWHCHERRRLYELRRAYIDGGTRVQLVDWPSPTLKFGEAVAAARRMVFFLTTKRFDSMVDPDKIRHFLRAETYRYGTLEPTVPVRLYLESLGFAQTLTEGALRLCPDRRLPEGVWIDLFRFTTMAVVGKNLGITAATARTQSPSMLERRAWNVMHAFLSRGV